MFAAEARTAGGPWRRRDPSATALHALVREETESLVARAASSGRPLPRYVGEALRAYVRCGVLACGFARARCPRCGFDRLVAFSCKQRGLCPSCDGRRMTETAAELIERVLPDVPVRQWVLSLPWALRVPVARDPALLTKVSRIFIDAVRACLRAKVGAPGDGARVEIGAVTVVQRFGGSLNLNPHLHVLVFDGVYLCAQDGTSPSFVATPPPTAEDRAAVLAEVAARVARIRTASPDDGLDAWRAGAGAPGHFARIRDENAEEDVGEDRAARRGAATTRDGFNLHTGVRVAGDDRNAVERLCRYALRPAICAARVAALEGGGVAYQMKHPRHGGETHRVMTRMEFMARVAALIPPPRYPLVRYHGVLAPNSPWRAMVVPGPRRPHHRDLPRQRSAIALAMTAAGAGEAGSLPRRDWATLLQRVWGIDALACARCGGRMRWIAVIRDRAVIEKILEHIGEESALPRMHRARDPC